MDQLSAGFRSNLMGNRREDSQQDPQGGLAGFQDLEQPPPFAQANLRLSSRADKPSDRAISPLNFEKSDLRTGSVSSRREAPSQSIRSKLESVTKRDETPSYFHQPVGHGDSVTGRGARVLFEEEVKADGSRDRLFRRLEAAESLLAQNHLETGVVRSPGDFRYLPSVSTQAPAGLIPERFVHGRESHSVLNNMAVRETKRSKARASDLDYKRRCSSSPSTLRTSIGLPLQFSPGQGRSPYLQSAPLGLTNGDLGDPPFHRPSPGCQPPFPGSSTQGGNGNGSD
jgi:hypothetical protein